MVRRRRNKVMIAAAVVVLGTAGGGLVLDRLLNPPENMQVAQKAESAAEQIAPQKEPVRDAFGEHFNAAAQLLASNQYEAAIEMLSMARRLKPHVPEVYVNLGFAYLGQNKPQQASLDFQKALSIRADQLNAYYGLAEALEATGDIEGALGAIRTYIHLAKEDDPFRRKAMSAAWEWQEALDKKRRESGDPAPSGGGEQSSGGVK